MAFCHLNRVHMTPFSGRFNAHRKRPNLYIGSHCNLLGSSPAGDVSCGVLNVPMFFGKWSSLFLHYKLHVGGFRVCASSHACTKSVQIGRPLSLSHFCHTLISHLAHGNQASSFIVKRGRGLLRPYSTNLNLPKQTLL